MNTVLRSLLIAAGILIVADVGASSAKAMDIVCTIKEVGIHAGGTADARAVARCTTAVNGVEWIAVPMTANYAEHFLDVMTSAFLSGRTVSAWGGSQGTGCFANCRITNSFSVYK